MTYRSGPWGRPAHVQRLMLAGLTEDGAVRLCDALNAHTGVYPADVLDPLTRYLSSRDASAAAEALIAAARHNHTTHGSRARHIAWPHPPVALGSTIDLSAPEPDAPAYPWTELTLTLCTETRLTRAEAHRLVVAVQAHALVAADQAAPVLIAALAAAAEPWREAERIAWAVSRYRSVHSAPAPSVDYRAWCLCDPRAPGGECPLGHPDMEPLFTD